MSTKPAEPVAIETPSTLKTDGEGSPIVAGDGDGARDDRQRRARLNEHLRQAFIEGAEEDSRRRLGRGLTTEELEPGAAVVPGRCWSRAPFDVTPTTTGVDHELVASQRVSKVLISVRLSLMWSEAARECGTWRRS